MSMIERHPPPPFQGRIRRMAAVGAILLHPLVVDASSWKLDVTLRVEGSYEVTAGGGSSCRGDYAFTLTWTGLTTEDDDDFLLVRQDERLEEWRAFETSTASGEGGMRSAADFPERPAFDHLFVLKENKVIRLVFALSGFGVPVQSTGEQAYLDLPRTAHSRLADSSVAYDRHVRRGSNSVSWPAELMRTLPLEQTFQWTWELSPRPFGREQALLLSQTHDVRLTVRLREVSDSRLEPF